MIKTHFPSLTGSPACWRTTGRINIDTSRVDCLNCRKTEAFKEQAALAAVAKVAAFNAQEPRRIREPWHRENVSMVCKECGSEEFRIGDRTCYGHYQSYVCVNGHTESRLTETGMSF